MNSVKIAYIIVSFIGDIFYLSAAVATPIWFTPGWYWWTAFFIILAAASSCGLTQRLNSWGDFGDI